MKLHPKNPTPGFEPKERLMIHYTKNEPAPDMGPAYYAAIHPNGVMIGTLEQEVDGYYYFFPVLRGGFWESWVLLDVARKLEALNEAWNNHLKSLDVKTPFEDHPGFTD